MHSLLVHGASAAADWEATSEAIADWAAATLDWDARADAADAAAAGSGAEPVPVVEQAARDRATTEANTRAARGLSRGFTGGSFLGGWGLGQAAGHLQLLSHCWHLVQAASLLLRNVSRYGASAKTLPRYATRSRGRLPCT